MQYDVNTVSGYCKCLSFSQDEIWTFGLFDETGQGGVVPGYGTFFSKCQELSVKLARLPDGSCSLHTTLNQTSLSGRRRDHIQAVRCLCADIDRQLGAATVRELQERWNPDMIVRTSFNGTTGKYHFYWKVSPMLKLDAWRVYQAGLAELLDGDRQLSEITHMIRVPGFERVCKDGSMYVPEIVWLTDRVMERTPAGVLAAFPGLVAAGEKGLCSLKEERRKVGAALAEIRRARGKRDLIVPFKDVPAIGRNVTLYAATREIVYQARLETLEEALDWALQMNSGFSVPLGEAEVATVARSAFEKGLRAWQKVREEMEVLLPADCAVDQDAADKRMACVATVAKCSEAVLENVHVPPMNGANGNGHKEEPTETVSDAIAKAMNRPKPEVHTVPRGLLPNALKDAVVALVDMIWSLPHSKQDDQRKAACRLIRNSMVLMNYSRLAAQVAVWWERIGHIDCKGITVNIREDAAWGAPVLGYETLEKEVFVAFICEFFSQLMGRAMETQMFGNKQKLPKWGKLKQAGEALWGTFSLSERRRRQAGDRVVFQSGVLDLEAGFFEPNPAEDPYKSAREHSHAIDARWAGADVDLERNCPMFCKFLQDWMPDDKGGWEVIMRWFGYSMTTDNSRQKFMWLEGPSGAGKGSLCGILGAIVGRRNRCSLNYGALDGDFEESAMHDKLTIAIQEATGTLSEHRARLERLKKIVSHEEVGIKRKYKRPMQDIIVGKLVIQSNEAPVFPDSGGALRHRMVAVGLEHSYRAECPRISPMDQVILAGECDAIATAAALAWMQARKSDGDPFKVEGAEMLAVGQEAIVGQMNVVNEICRKYLAVKKPGGVSNGALQDLITKVMLGRGIEPPARHGWAKLLKEVGVYFDDRVRAGMYRAGGKRRPGEEAHRVRGFLGLAFNKEAIFADYPELQEEVGEFPDLAAALGLQIDCGRLDQGSIV